MWNLCSYTQKHKAHVEAWHDIWGAQQVRPLPCSYHHSFWCRTVSGCGCKATDCSREKRGVMPHRSSGLLAELVSVWHSIHLSTLWFLACACSSGGHRLFLQRKANAEKQMHLRAALWKGNHGYQHGLLKGLLLGWRWRQHNLFHISWHNTDTACTMHQNTQKTFLATFWDMFWSVWGVTLVSIPPFEPNPLIQTHCKLRNFRDLIQNTPTGSGLVLSSNVILVEHHGFQRSFSHLHWYETSG